MLSTRASPMCDRALEDGQFPNTIAIHKCLIAHFSLSFSSGAGKEKKSKKVKTEAGADVASVPASSTVDYQIQPTKTTPPLDTSKWPLLLKVHCVRRNSKSRSACIDVPCVSAIAQGIWQSHVFRCW